MGSMRLMPTVRATVAVLIVLPTAACAAAETQPHSVITTDRDGLRTFSVVRELDGNPVACAAFTLADPVDGSLQGDPAGRPDTVWLEGPDGRHLSVVWPGGFTVRFDPAVSLVDDLGKVVASAGDPVTLDQVRPDSHAGTFQDPYIASGGLFGGCYPFIP
jgi:hypothetical protein